MGDILLGKDLPMKARSCFLISLVAALSLTACGAQPAAPTMTSVPTVAPVATAAVAPTAAAKPVLKTALGDLMVISARFVSEVHGETPAPGLKILLVGLERADGTSIDLQAFQTAQLGTHILGDDGSETISPMAGFVENEFVMGFRLPETVKTYTLVWPGNDPVKIVPAD
jgi:hypothetical protein